MLLRGKGDSARGATSPSQTTTRLHETTSSRKARAATPSRGTSKPCIARATLGSQTDSNWRNFPLTAPLNTETAKTATPNMGNKRIAVIFTGDEIARLYRIRADLETELGSQLSTAAVVRIIMKRYEEQNA